MLEAGLGGLASVGAEPGLSAGAVLAISLRTVTWSLGLEGRVDLPAAIEVGRGGIRASIAAGTLAPCLRSGRFGACALLTAGALHSSGYDLPNSREATTPYAAVGPRVLLDARFQEAFAFRFHAEVQAPLTRTTLLVGGGELWSTPPLVGALGLSLVGSLPTPWSS